MCSSFRSGASRTCRRGCPSRSASRRPDRRCTRRTETLSVDALLQVSPIDVVVLLPPWSLRWCGRRNGVSPAGRGGARGRRSRRPSKLPMLTRGVVYRREIVTKGLLEESTRWRGTSQDGVDERIGAPRLRMNPRIGDPGAAVVRRAPVGGSLVTVIAGNVGRRCAGRSAQSRSGRARNRAPIGLRRRLPSGGAARWIPTCSNSFGVTGSCSRSGRRWALVPRTSSRSAFSRRTSRRRSFSWGRSTPTSTPSARPGT